MIFRVPLLVACLLATAVATVSARAPERGSWRVARLDGLEVYSTAGDRETQRVFDEVHAFRHAVAKVLPLLDQVPRSDLRIVIVDHPRRLEAALPEAVEVFESLAGLHHQSPLFDTIIIDLSANASRRELVQHEVVHHLLAHLAAPVPPWMNEGIAEAFSGAEPSGKHFTFGKMKRGGAEAVVNVGPLPAQYLLRAYPSGTDPMTSTLYYGTAQLLAHEAIFGQDRGYSEGFFRLMEHRERFNPDEALVQELLGTDFAGLGRRAVEYGTRGRYRYFRLPREELPPAPRLEPRPIAADERAALLASLALRFDPDRAPLLLDGAGDADGSWHLALARFELANGEGRDLDPRWLETLERAASDPAVPSHVTLACILARLGGREHGIPHAELAAILDKVGAYQRRRGLTRTVRVAYVEAWAFSDTPPGEEAIPGLVALAEHFDRDPLFLAKISVALAKAGALDRIDHVLSRLPGAQQGMIRAAEAGPPPG